MKEHNIDEFYYTRAMRAYTKSEPKKTEEGKISGGSKIARLKANRKINEQVRILLKGTKEDRLLAKQIKLEKEYIIAKCKRDLSILIESKLNCDASGIFTLAEIGEVLGLTRERVRQLESSALKVLIHPNTGRSSRMYKES